VVIFLSVYPDWPAFTAGMAAFVAFTLKILIISGNYVFHSSTSVNLFEIPIG
jgi:hypothetical protein